MRPSFDGFCDAFNALEVSEAYQQADAAQQRALEEAVFRQWDELLIPIVEANIETILEALHANVSSPGLDALHVAYWFGDWWFSLAEPYGSYPWLTYTTEAEIEQAKRGFGRWAGGK